MHKLERTQPEPPSLKSARENGLSDWDEFPTSDKKTVRDELLMMQNFRCAYCERTLHDVSNEAENKWDGLIEHFRRKDQNFHPELTFVWENLFYSCCTGATCGNCKDNFVNDKSQYALLIDPCKENPEDFFIFDSKIIYYPNPADVDHKEPHMLSPANPYHFKELFKLKSYYDSNISTLEVSDDSMAPRICKGDLVKIQKQKEYEENNIVAIILDKNEITLRKIKKENNGMWFLSTNPSYPPLFYSNTELNESKVLFLGKVYSLYAEF